MPITRRGARRMTGVFRLARKELRKAIRAMAVAAGLTVAVLVLGWWTRAAAAAESKDTASTNLAVNGNLTEGTGVTPAGWQAHGWAPGGTIFNWEPGAKGGELQIVSNKPDDAQWTQRLKLGAGWYHFSAQIRTRDVGLKNTGASLCLLQNWISSEELHGTNDWHPVDFYLKVGQGGGQVDLACRLGGYGNLNT
ncbi:MAG TPA: hypothetical protein VHY56_04400, partial [Candidatus Binataceae bacterium]|nr:hypothetical protein [Candidatus Binataceae bacterium]